MKDDIEKLKLDMEKLSWKEKSILALVVVFAILAELLLGFMLIPLTIAGIVIGALYFGARDIISDPIKVGGICCLALTATFIVYLLG